MTAEVVLSDLLKDVERRLAILTAVEKPDRFEQGQIEAYIEVRDFINKEFQR